MLNYRLVCKDLHTVAGLGGGLAADRTHQRHQLSVKLTMFIVGIGFVNYPVSLLKAVHVFLNGFKMSDKLYKQMGQQLSRRTAIFWDRVSSRSLDH